MYVSFQAYKNYNTLLIREIRLAAKFCQFIYTAYIFMRGTDVPFFGFTDLAQLHHLINTHTYSNMIEYT